MKCRKSGLIRRPSKAKFEDIKFDIGVIKAEKSVLNSSITHHKLCVFMTVLSFGLLGLDCVGAVDCWIVDNSGGVYTAGQNALCCKHRHTSSQVTDNSKRGNVKVVLSLLF